MNYLDVGLQIKKARLRRGWSQEHAAAQVGTSRIHWIRWEQGLHRPTGRLAQRLVEVLELPESLFDDEERDSAVENLTRGLRAFVRSEMQREASS